LQTKTEVLAHRPELIFAFVGPAGVHLDEMSRVLKERLKKDFQYEPIDIRLSALLRNVTDWTDEPDKLEPTRITHGQEWGNKFRRKLNDGAALARAGIAAIREKRAGISHSPDHPAPEVAYIVQQLKHPAEVELLRRVYGSSFVLLAGHAPLDVRVKGLSERMATKDKRPGDLHYREKAEHIIQIDDKEDDDLGQNTRDTYPLADLFVNLSRDSGDHSVKRFVDLLFGHPFHTPYPEEYAMYQASAVALRSSDESRQVGAVIVASQPGKVTNVDIVASGMNEVPRRGGGFYWQDDSPDGRDQWLVARNDDRAHSIKISALVELIEKIRKKEWFNETVNGLQAADLADKLLPDLIRTKFMDIGEFMRPVHAEMAALIDSARRGVAVNGHTMYVTTFPCHNCAKHIIAAGLRRVVYLEPYPKSKATLLHGEEINLESTDEIGHDDRVVFSAFSGVAPRQYQQLFSMSARGSKKWLALNKWNAVQTSLSPRYVARNASEAYLLAERQELEKLSDDVYRWNKKAVCPVS